MKSVIILGSSRRQGNTAQLAQHLASEMNAEIVDLASYHIQPYDYEHNNQSDDFASLMEHILSFDHLIFASPIYWYSASATMKLFLDRMCDLIEIDKKRGRSLKQKTASVISTGAAQEAVSCFEPVFSLTFDYFNMQYNGMLYCCCPQVYHKDEHDKKLSVFVRNITPNTNPS
ncbi:flavodoxin family protein [Algibacillus agarilyticus]|uniref:flavodoxin family protein n=1 Tax=Algibacillus agarilyticus TaxID=2234133 RepID=UPI000DCFD3C3|nr:NAD(P)H-dependent oxidoreductase [Algibacillus agarilyticus]